MPIHIPRVLHQTWRSRHIPSKLSHYVRSWRRQHPDWRYRLWLDSDLDALVRRWFPAMHRVWQAYPRAIQRADVGRCLVLERYGGVYADLDVECIQPIDAALHDVTCLLATEPKLHAERLYGRNRLVSNAIMASVPAHPFWAHLRHCFLQYSVDSTMAAPVASTGPLALDDAVRSWTKGGIRVVHPDVFCPLPDLTNKRLELDQATRAHYKEMLQRGLWPAKTLAVHFWAHTWFRAARYRHSMWDAWQRIRSGLRPGGRRDTIPSI